MEYTEEQRSAIGSNKKKIALEAVAGAGKTTTLVARIERLIKEGIDPRKMVAMTFSNNMALVLENKIEHDLRYIGTYHSTFYNLLQGKLHHYGFDGSPAIISAEDDKIIKKHIMQQIRARFSLKALEKMLSRYFLRPNMRITDPEFRAFINYWFQELKSNNIITYDLIEYYMLEYSKSGDNFGIEHLFLDEFHDTSEMERRIIMNMNTENMFAVFDRLQCIYEWRDSRPENVDDYLEIADKHLTLSKSFRCSKPIVQEANKVVDHYGTGLKLKSDKDGSKVDIMPWDLNMFMNLLLNKYLEMYEPEDIFILCRTNRQVKKIEKLLMETYDVKSVLSRQSQLEVIMSFIHFLRMKESIYNDYSVEKFLLAMKLKTSDEVDVLQIEARSTGMSLYDVVREKRFMDDYFSLLKDDEISIIDKCEIFYNSSGFSSEQTKEALRLIKGIVFEYGEDAATIIKALSEMHPMLSQGIKIMTYHQAKGLESRVVVCPFARPTQTLKGEEIRLMYVAYTRAKNKLLIRRFDAR